MSHIGPNLARVQAFIAQRAVPSKEFLVSRTTFNLNSYYRAMLLLAVMLTCAQASKRLPDKADAIVVGEVQSGHMNGTEVTFYLTVTRTIKGEIAKGAALSVSWDSRRYRGGGDVGVHFGLWYLQSSGQDRWTVLPPTEGPTSFSRIYIPLSKSDGPENRGSASKPSNVSQGIAEELSYAVEHSRDPDHLRRAAHGLFDISDEGIRMHTFQNLRMSGDLEVKFVGLTGLVMSKDIPALEQIAQNATVIPKLTTSDLVRGAIAQVRDGSSAAVQALGKISISNEAVVQRAAAESLCAIHTREALPFLGNMLESPDMQARELAMRGLSMFVENLPIVTLESIPSQRWRIRQGPARYRTPDTDRYAVAERPRGMDPAQEKEFLTFWKSWWNTMKIELAK